MFIFVKKVILNRFAKLNFNGTAEFLIPVWHRAIDSTR
jgi:hypothetical protein